MDESSDIRQRLASLERECGRLRDLRDIEDVLTRYSRALDWLDDAQLDGVFFDDAEIDYGFFKGDGRTFKPLLMQFERSMGRRWHFTSQVKIALDGDRAEVESYNLSVAATATAALAGADLNLFVGFYLDRLERRDGRWGIARRKHLLVAAATLDELPVAGPLAALNAIGDTTRTHPDYRRLS
jgi:hypothetical protein